MGNPSFGGSIDGNSTNGNWIYTNTDKKIYLSDVIKIYSTDVAFAALTKDKNVFVWGDPDNGGFTNGNWIYTDNNKLLFDVVKIYTTQSAFAALTNNGNVFVWGSPSLGGSSVYNNSTYRGYIYTGDGKYDNTNNEKLSGVVKIYSTNGAFASLTKDGNVFVWGDSNSGGSSVTGNNEKRGWIYITNNKLLADVVKIYSTYKAFASLKNNGDIFTWGDPIFGGQINKTPLKLKRNYKKFIFATNGAFCEMAQYDNNKQIPFYVKTISDYPKKISNDVLMNAIYENSSIYCNNL